MTDNVRNIRRVSLSEQATVARKIVAMAEKLMLLAKTPTQKRRVSAKLEEMRGKRDRLIARAKRVEGYHD